MLHRLALPLAFIAFTLSLAPARAADTATPVPPADPFAKLESAGVKFTRGPATAALGSVAELKVPAGFAFIGADGVKRFYQLTQNTPSGDEVGVLLDPGEMWTLFFDYNATGYVKDDEKLDADQLLKALTADESEINEARKERGWDAMKITGWATAPHYDTTTHHLKWAINLTSSRDNFKSVFINESIRLLGRGGVMKVTLVCDTEDFKASEVAVDKLLAADFSYVSGQKYSEWKSGDKIAAYGLGALVLGGAGVVASKAGLFAKLGVFFAKFIKVIIVGFVALGAFFAKLWKKITGRT